jgi:hypothetical protein
VEREVTDGEGTTWRCVQAFSGGTGAAGSALAQRAAEKMAEGDGRVAVSCTPSGGQQSVRIELPPDWADRLPDEELLAAIAAARAEGQGGE